MIRSRIHERAISLRVLSLILRVLKLGVSVYYVFHYKPVFNHFCSGEGGESVRRGDCEQQGGKLLRLLSQARPRIWPPCFFKQKGRIWVGSWNTCIAIYWDSLRQNNLFMKSLHPILETNYAIKIQNDVDQAAVRTRLVLF